MENLPQNEKVDTNNNVPAISDEQWVKREVQRIIHSFVNCVSNLENCIKAIPEFRRKLDAFAQTPGISSATRDQVRQFHLEFESIITEMENAVAVFSQMRTPFAPLLRLQKEGFRGPSGSVVILPLQIERLGYKYCHQFGNTIKGLFDINAQVMLAADRLPLEDSSLITRMSEILAQKTTLLEENLKYLEESRREDAIYNLLGLSPPPASTT